MAEAASAVAFTESTMRCTRSSNLLEISLKIWSAIAIAVAEASRWLFQMIAAVSAATSTTKMVAMPR